MTSAQQPGAAPHGPRKRLGGELHRLRRLAGLSGRDIAALIGASQAHVSRVESGRASATLPQVIAWADATGADNDVRKALTELTEAALHEADAWRTRFGDGVTAMQQRAGELEATAGIVTCFQPSFVPGLLQTAEYARRIVELTDVRGWSDHAAAIVARLERQQALYQPHRRFEFLVTEAALRLQVGPPHVMRGQVDRIISAMSLDSVQLGIVPLDAEASVIPWVGFSLYDHLADDQPAFATVELPHAWLTVSDPGDVEIYQQQLSSIRDAALLGRDAERLLEGIGRTTLI